MAHRVPAAAARPAQVVAVPRVQVPRLRGVQLVRHDAPEGRLVQGVRDVHAVRPQVRAEAVLPDLHARVQQQGHEHDPVRLVPGAIGRVADAARAAQGAPSSAPRRPRPPSSLPPHSSGSTRTATSPPRATSSRWPTRTRTRAPTAAASAPPSSSPRCWSGFRRRTATASSPSPSPPSTRCTPTTTRWCRTRWTSRRCAPRSRAARHVTRTGGRGHTPHPRATPLLTPHPPRSRRVRQGDHRRLEGVPRRLPEDLLRRRRLPPPEREDPPGELPIGKVWQRRLRHAAAAVEEGGPEGRRLGRREGEGRRARRRRQRRGHEEEGRGRGRARDEGGGPREGCGPAARVGVGLRGDGRLRLLRGGLRRRRARRGVPRLRRRRRPRRRRPRGGVPAVLHALRRGVPRVLYAAAVRHRQRGDAAPLGVPAVQALRQAQLRQADRRRRRRRRRQRPVVESVRCSRCDKAYHAGCMPGNSAQEKRDGCAYWMCYDCRACEGCGRSHKATAGQGSWSADGLWCAACAHAGVEGRYCGVCSLPFDNNDLEAATMVQCDRCELWVHPQCDGMDEQTYMAYTEGAPGYESYLCCDCRPEDSAAAEEPMWRLLARMVRRVQQRRIHFSPELCAGSDAELGVSVGKHARRAAAADRWLRERAAAKAPWALARFGGVAPPPPPLPPPPPGLSRPSALVHAGRPPQPAAARPPMPAMVPGMGMPLGGYGSGFGHSGGGGKRSPPSAGAARAASIRSTAGRASRASTCRSSAAAASGGRRASRAAASTRRRCLRGSRPPPPGCRRRPPPPPARAPPPHPVPHSRARSSSPQEPPSWRPPHPSPFRARSTFRRRLHPPCSARARRRLLPPAHSRHGRSRRPPPPPRWRPPRRRAPR